MVDELTEVDGLLEGYGISAALIGSLWTSCGAVQVGCSGCFKVDRSLCLCTFRVGCESLMSITHTMMVGTVGHSH